MNAKELIERELPRLPGWCTPEKGVRMAELARGASLCVELGVFGGRGIAAISAALREQGFGEAHGIDPYTVDAALEGTNSPENDRWWSRLDLAEIGRAACISIEQLGLTAWAKIFWERSQDVVGRYADSSIDLLHADSNHSEEVTCAEVALWSPKIRQGGIWIADDVNWETTKKAQQLLLECGFDRTEDHETWAVFRKR